MSGRLARFVFLTRDDLVQLPLGELFGGLAKRRRLEWRQATRAETEEGLTCREEEGCGQPEDRSRKILFRRCGSSEREGVLSSPAATALAPRLGDRG